MESQDETETPTGRQQRVGNEDDDGVDGSSQNPWFKKPKYMSEWLYKFFRGVVQPISHYKVGDRYAFHPIFSQNQPHTPPSLWINPPDPLYLMMRREFKPETLWRPRVFLWLIHHFVPKLMCPSCGGCLEKNGALPPRRVVDMDSVFYIVAWAYYCRKGCRRHFHGWNHELVASLPAYVQLAFPAVLSRKSGLSHNVISTLRSSNQHKMGPNGVRSLLFELHTRRYNVLLLQYLEAIFEHVHASQTVLNKEKTLADHLSHAGRLPSFGNFSDRERYGGFVPTERYLSSMLNKAVERDEPAANQHTALLEADHLSIDDSHKMVKHMVQEDGVVVHKSLWTAMTKHFIRAQALCITKSHDERFGPLMGIANSSRVYGLSDPEIVFTDDPVKDKRLIYSVYPKLASTTPIAAAYGLKPFQTLVQPVVLSSPESVNSVLSPLADMVGNDDSTSLCLSIDAEWNVSRTVGVSVIQIAPHTEPETAYIIPVHRFRQLPTSLLQLLTSDRVFKIGSGIKGDLTRLSKQFPQQLGTVRNFCVIDLKDYATHRGKIHRGDDGSLGGLSETVLGCYLPKDDGVRLSEDWEKRTIPPDLLEYATGDVMVSRSIFETLSAIEPIVGVTISTSPDTPIGILSQMGGLVIAWGHISKLQPKAMDGIQVQVPTLSRLVVEVTDLT
ncbi:hypothetical protein V5O48_018932 [Marasmius crinis-equi]|uniref:3'-5' exonuclease n=1 Tax=Marasmius crinis-equi TaxID=585013 RepID=A0ABR3EJT1_9AGAR